MGEAALTGLELTGREYRALAVLSGGAPGAQHRVGVVLGVDRTSTVALLRGLERRGLVLRERDPENRRAYRITLTATGESVRARAARALERCDRQFVAPLSVADTAHLRASLHTLLG